MSASTPKPEQNYLMWRVASPLRDAWFWLGDEELRVQYQDGKNRARAEVAKQQMASDLFRDVADGNFTALGLRHTPDVSDGPVVIKPWLFDQPLTERWEWGEISLGGYSYTEVRIFSQSKHIAAYNYLINKDALGAGENIDLDNIEPKFNSDLSAGGEEFYYEPVLNTDDKCTDQKGERNADSVSNGGGAEILKGPGGRPNSYPRSKKVFDELFAEKPEYFELSAQLLLPIFKAKYAIIHKEILKQVPPVGERKLRDQLKRYKSERTGTNRNK